jgi:TPR repeat protein
MLNHHCTNIQIQILRMPKTRRGSRKCIKRKQTRRMRHYKKGGAPKVDPSKQKKEKDKVMAHSIVPAAADAQLPFTPAARDLLQVQGASADYMMQHLGIKTPNIHHHDPLSAVRAPLEGARARVIFNTTMDAIHASVDRFRARGDFANAVVQLDRALELGSMRARVELADILYDGRVGAISRVHADMDGARALLDVEDEVVRNNPDCMGLRAFFELEEPSRQHDRARLCNESVKSARANSKYGIFALGTCLMAESSRSIMNLEGTSPRVIRQRARALHCFEISANANYDRAQNALGSECLTSAERQEQEQPNSAEAGRNRDKALRLFTSAANQGLRIAMFNLGDFYKTEAERLRMMVGDADLRRMISDARHWYQRSDYYVDVDLEDLDALEMSLEVGNDEYEDEEDEDEDEKEEEDA